jgi:hypothetical protein
MLVKNTLRAVYSRTVHGNIILIEDLNGPKSVTNDAYRPGLIMGLDASFDLSKYLVIYRDSRGIYDQLLVDCTGHFAGFASVNERDLFAALAKLTRH